jgi:uncharacterized membrane protein (Fun14 family)
MAETFGLHTYQFTKAKWMILAVATTMIGLGLFLSLGGSSSASGRPIEAGAESQAEGGILGSSFAESRGNQAIPPSAAVEEQGRAVSVLSPFLLKGGFGMFIGFAIGFALRAFLRLAVVLLGCYLVSLALLAYLGWIEVHWNVMEDQFTRSLTTLGEQFTSFQAFLTGAVPASGMTALGLAVGLRKR